MHRWIKLVLLVLFSTAAYTFNNIFPIPGWFDALRSDVWTLSFAQVNAAEFGLYLLSGIAFWLLWRDRALSDIPWAAWGYGGILILSSMWSMLFFGHEMPILAFMDMLALTALTAFVAARFYRYERLAGYLVVPCVAGAFFFAVNNFMLYRSFVALGIS